MNNQTKDKCIDCGGKGVVIYKKGEHPDKGTENKYTCLSCKGTGEGETKVYTHGSIEHEGERWIRSIDHENLIALALQEQREEMEQIVYGSMRTGGDVIVTTLLNGEIKKIVKAIKNLK